MADGLVKIGLIGLGTVGGGVAQMLREKADLYARRAGKRIELRRVLVRDVEKAVKSGEVDRALITNDADAFFETQMEVVVEVAGGVEAMEPLVCRALESKRHVVTANKSLLASKGPSLFALARKHNVSIAFEASCCGGIPCITAIQFGLMANRIDALYGILNGTCNFILTQMTTKGKSYADALVEAQELGYAEADPALDVSGVDAAQKLAILASLAFGVKVSGDQVSSTGIDTLDLEDIRFGREMGYDIKLLGIAERGEGTSGDGACVSVSVRPCFLPCDALLGRVSGAFNALSVHGDALGHSLYYGAGAGRMPTASAVVSDILNVASGWYPHAFASMRLTIDCHEPVELMDGDELVSRYYVRIHAMDLPGAMAQITAALSDCQISISAVSQHERNEGKHVPVVVLTHEACEGNLQTAVAKISSLDCVEGEPVVIRVVDL